MENKCVVCGAVIPEGTQVCKDCDLVHRPIKADNVNHPSHYTDGKIEVIDFIEDKGLNYHRGNAVKYISRAGKKNPEKEIEDLQKAAWYINREIERLQATPKLGRLDVTQKTYDKLREKGALNKDIIYFIVDK